MSQIKLVQQLFRARAPDFQRNRLHLKHSKDVLFHRQLTKNAGLLREIADPKLPRPEVHGNARDIDLIDEDLARIGNDQTDNHVKASGLARAIGAEQTYHFALADLEVYTPNHLATLIGLADFVCTKLLHSFGNPGLGYYLGSAAGNHDAIIAIIENQRVAGYCSADLITQPRRHGAAPGKQELAIRRGVGELLAGPFASGLLKFHRTSGDDL